MLKNTGEHENFGDVVAPANLKPFAFVDGKLHSSRCSLTSALPLIRFELHFGSDGSGLCLFSSFVWFCRRRRRPFISGVASAFLPICLPSLGFPSRLVCRLPPLSGADPRGLDGRPGVMGHGAQGTTELGSQGAMGPGSSLGVRAAVGQGPEGEMPEALTPYLDLHQRPNRAP